LNSLYLVLLLYTAEAESLPGKSAQVS